MELQRIEIGQLKPDFQTQIKQIVHFYHDQGRNPLFYWTDELISSEFIHSTWWILKDSEQILGFVSTRQSFETIEIICLAAHPGFSGRGLMKNLLKFLIDNAYSQNLRVLLEVHENNLKAISLYLKMGFKKINSRKAYYRDGGAAIVLESIAGA